MDRFDQLREYDGSEPWLLNNGILSDTPSSSYLAPNSSSGYAISGYNNPGFATTDSAYGTSDATFDTGELNQSVSYLPQIQPSMGGAIYQPELERSGNDVKRRCVGRPRPNDSVGFRSAIHTDIGAFGSECLSKKIKALELWHSATIQRPEATPEVISEVSKFFQLPENIVEEFFESKGDLKANEVLQDGGSNVMPMRPTRPVMCSSQSIDPILLGPMAAARPFDGEQQSMQFSQALVARRTLTHRLDGNIEKAAQQVQFSPENHAAETMPRTTQDPNPDWLRSVIDKYLKESPNRCHESRQSKTKNQIYSCTSRCGRTFKKCGDWKRHEEINQPQNFYVCLICPEAKPWIHHRKDKWTMHIALAHADVRQPSSHVHEDTRTIFKPRCGFCGDPFHSWKQRCDHVGQHFTGKLEKQPIEEWKDPWVDPPKEAPQHGKGPTGPPDNDRNNPDYSPGSGGAGAPPSNGRSNSSSSGFGFSSGRRSGAGDGPSQRTPYSSNSRQCMPSFEKPKDSSRTDAQDFLLGSHKRHYYCNHASKSADDHDIPLDKPDTLFHTLDMLGCGFHSIVKKVEHCPTGRIFARKTIRNAGKGISIVERFRTEVNIMKRLNHPHIIRFVAEYMDNLSFHVIMSPVAEHNLKECLDNPETLPQNHVLLKSIGCLASAVAYLHSVRVRHKDIKPQNILVKDSKVFLTDFGISKTWTDVESTTDSVSAMTPMYAAPEVAARGKHGTKADVFSLGLVFLEIIAVTNEGSINRLRSHLHNSPDCSMTQNLAFGPLLPRDPKPKPYYANIRPILEWTTTLHFQASLRPQCVAGLRELLHLCRLMLQQNPVERPTASQLTQNMPPEFSCGSCSSCIRQSCSSGKLQIQLALVDPFLSSKTFPFSRNSISPKVASSVTYDPTNSMRAADLACDISLATLLTGAIHEWGPDYHSDFGYIIGRKPLFFGTSLQKKQDAKRMFDILNFLEQPRLEGNVDLTSVQLPHSDDLLGCGTGLDYSTRNRTVFQDQSIIELGESILTNASCRAQRRLGLEPGLGYGDLFFIDNSHKSTLWSDVFCAVDFEDLIAVAEIGSN